MSIVRDEKSVLGRFRPGFDKIRRWFKRVVERDLFAADRRGAVDIWIARCAGLLHEFEQEVYRRQSRDLPDEIGLGPLLVVGGSYSDGDDEIIGEESDE